MEQQNILEKSNEKVKLKENISVTIQPLATSFYTTGEKRIELEVLERKQSEAEGVGEVLYFVEAPTVPHLAKYFDNIIILKDETSDLNITNTNIQS